MNKRYQKKTNNMTRKEFDSLYLYKAVHCDTEEKANEFLALAESVGYKWFSGSCLTGRNFWEDYEKETYYYITNDGILFGNINYLRQDGYQIIKYQPQPKFKVGDKIRVNNPSFTTLNGEVGVIVEVNTLSPLSYAVKIGHKGCAFWFFERQLEKVEEPKETTETLIDDIRATVSEINILLNRLEKKEKGE